MRKRKVKVAPDPVAKLSGKLILVYTTKPMAK